MSDNFAGSVRLCSKCNYKLCCLVGHGNHGIVYKACIYSCGCSIFHNVENIAVKKLIFVARAKKELEEEKQSLRKRCLRLIELNNDNLIRYFGTFVEEETADIMMDYCADGDLERYIVGVDNGVQMLTKAMITEFTKQITLGVQFLHKNHIIHTDLKPSNVFMKPTDNRSFRLMTGDVDDCVVMAGNITGERDISALRGTPRFVSPEMVLSIFLQVETHQCGRKTDIWSLGVIVLDLMDCVLGNKGGKTYFNQRRGHKDFVQFGSDRFASPFRIMCLIKDGYRPTIPVMDGLEDIVYLCLFDNQVVRISADSFLKKLQPFCQRFETQTIPP